MDEFELIKKYFQKISINNPSAKKLNEDVFFDKKNSLVVTVDTYNEGFHFPNIKFPNLVIKREKTFGSWKVCFDDAKYKPTHNVVTVILVAKIIAATRYAQLSNAIIPAIIDKTPAARTSVTISSNATHDAFDVEIPFFTM